ncbi:MAG: tetraacyldisaccharide 4'-kinase [Candidatus Cloacimonetes bacterium]|nr:tetraacyldisaccharide 4'-kinase [Candidatus Cloacimonadota bacterium]
MSAHSFIEKHWVKRSILSYLFLPLAFLFSLILCLRRILYSYRFFRSYKADAFIISVGNHTVGGNGKTPFTILLAHALKHENLKVAVSHRGYKGAFEHTIKLISDEEQIFEDTYLAGDEPLLIANNCKGIPVIVGSNRKAAIKFLQNKFSPNVIILDDSFQHLHVKHDYDFLLFNGKNPIGNGFVIPAGMLREPASAIKHADCYVMNDISDEYYIPKQLKKYSAPLISTTYQIRSLIHFQDSKEEKLGSVTGKKVMLVSGIGNPLSFENSLQRCGFDIVNHLKFKDHHEYNDNDVHEIIKKAEKSKADMIITTEKDYVKLKNLNIDYSKFYYAKLKVIINEFEIFNGIVDALKKEM